MKFVLTQFWGMALPGARPRELVLPTELKKVVAVTGIRRAGKTFIFFDTMRRLAASGVDRRDMIYLNLEDDRLYPVRAEELDLILRTAAELHPQKPGRTRYLFLDEIQSVPGWERYVRRILDTEDVRVFVTGSSSKVLTRDIASTMRGRSLTFMAHPLSFAEYLDFSGIRHVPYDAGSESRVRAALENYLRWGGFPEVVCADDAIKPLYLEEYVSLMLFRDLVERHRIRNERAMRLLLRFCLRHPASLLSVNKLTGDFRSLGVALSRDTLYEYMDHLEDASIVGFVGKYSHSLRRQEQAARKLMLADTGLATAVQVRPEMDWGHRLENAVYLQMRRNRQTPAYIRNGSEVDLCSADGAFFVNMAWSLTETSTIDREKKALAYGRRMLPDAEARVLYHDLDPTLWPDESAHQPAWQWLLA